MTDHKMSDEGWIASDAPVTNLDGAMGHTTEGGRVHINAEFRDEEGNIVDFSTADGSQWFTDGRFIIYDLGEQ
jgi:hypothetical protein